MHSETEAHPGITQARLAMNAVTLRNFSLPLRIATFEKDLFAGFSLVRCPFLLPFAGSKR